MESEYFHDGSEGLQTESRAYSRFRLSGDKELDVGYLLDVVGEDRQDGGGWFFILALVEGIDDDQSPSVDSFERFERTDDEPLHLRTEGLPSNVRVGLQNSKQFHSKGRIAVGELEGEGRKDRLQVVPILEVPRTEEAGTQPPVCEAHLGECLGDGRFSRPCEAVQPEHALIPLVRQPVLELEKDFLPRSPQAPLPVPGTVTSARGVAHAVEKREVHRFLFAGYTRGQMVRE